MIQPFYYFIHVQISAYKSILRLMTVEISNYYTYIKIYTLLSFL